MERIKFCVAPSCFQTLVRAGEYSNELLSRSSGIIGEYFARETLDLSGICFAVVGSTGRREALEESDLDIIPVARDAEALGQYVEHDGPLRKALGDGLNIEVSKGEALTKATCIDELIKTDTIGGENDCRNFLTKRILILTESAQGGGTLAIRTVRESILDAYAAQERTSGRHVLTLCNDIARYYKTLCVEYKGRVDDKNKNWCKRNIKLRHSRKLWYFANILTISTLAGKHPQGKKEFADELLDCFQRPPVQRLANALIDTQPLTVGKILENYALYLEFMARSDNRNALSKVEHSERYRMSLDNPFPAMKFSSDVLHHHMMSVLEEMGPAMRARIIGWFLL